MNSYLLDRADRLVSIKEFLNAGAPIKLASIELECSLTKQYILRMPVRVEGGKRLIPDELAWTKPMFDLCLDHNLNQVKANHPFCYITVRHGLVESTTDDEWHVDGFSTRIPHVPEQNYIWSSRTATEYASLNVDFPEGFDSLRHNVNHYLEKWVSEVQQCRNKTIYCVDPYILHRRPKNVTEDMGKSRTFVRISFVPIAIDDRNNSVNPLLPVKSNGDGVAFRNQLTDYPEN